MDQAKAIVEVILCVAAKIRFYKCNGTGLQVLK